MAGGRPKKFKDEYLVTARVLAKMGATWDEIAEALSVGRSTVFRWASEIPEFRDAIKVGKKAADERVERALYNRAVGTTRKVQKVVSYMGNYEIVDVVEEVPADVGAAAMWLTNRQRKAWQKTPEDNQDGKAPPMNIVIQVNDASTKAEEPDDEDL